MLIRTAALLAAAGFIFGGNERRESVAMTSPVRTERVGGRQLAAAGRGRPSSAARARSGPVLVGLGRLSRAAKMNNGVIGDG